jgi:hypothetical protein
MKLEQKKIITEINNFSEIPDNDKSPFVEELQINTTKVLKRFKKGEVILDEHENLSFQESKSLTIQNEKLKLKGLEIGQIKVKQKAEFVIIYTNNIPYKNLSEVSFKIFHYILDKRISLGSDMIILSIEDCCEHLKFTRPTVAKGFVELVKNKIIAKRCENVWWINPNYYYAGNRLNIKTK